MAFRNIPLDLVLPPGGLLTPGSSTIYLGGPRLPSELKVRGDVGAIVFYSNPSGFAAGIKYWYISHGTVVEDVTLGYCKTTGSLQDVWISQYDSLSFNPDQLFSVNEFFVSASSIISFINASGDIHMMTQASGDVIMGGYPSGQPELHVYGWHSATTVAIKALFTNQDQWNSYSTTQNALGVTWTLNYDWRLTPDYILEVRYLISGPGGNANGNVSFTGPPAIAPYLDAGPSTGVGVRCGYGTMLTFPPLTTIAARLSLVSSVACQLDTWNVPANITQLEGGIVVTVPKP